jgi:pimeloyl-ACP methyl ester carboxylesterase
MSVGADGPDDGVAAIYARGVRGSLNGSTPRPNVAFLPGAGGAASFWEPVARRLPSGWTSSLLGWPGAGDGPHDPSVGSFEALSEFAAAQLGDGTDVVAQSMGGVVAVRLALAHPAKVRRLVLVATSGGIDMAALGAADWRTDYRAEYPDAARWITEERIDYTTQLARITAPTLLLWGDADPISPVAVGERLASLIPTATLRVIRGGTHDMAGRQPDEIARPIIEHLND